MHFGSSLGEDAQDGESVQTMRVNESMPVNNPEGSGTLSSLNTVGVLQNEALPPPPPAFFLGYTLPPGHRCNSFTLPPPPADKKRTGPRRKFCHFLLCYFRCFIVHIRIEVTQHSP